MHLSFYNNIKSEFKYFIILFFSFFICLTANSQVVNTGINDTAAEKSLKKFNVSVYVDAYWGTDFQNKSNADIPYLVSMNKINQPNINLAMIDFRYQSKNLRVKLLPGFGTYMKANYSNETGIAQYLVEANAGILLSKKRSIWLDAGILSSPYTNESAISKDQLLYTRAMGPEYSPYYLTGFKASIPIHKKINLYLYLINGWQEIKRQGNSLAFGTQVEYRPNDKNLFNWNTYLGNESSSITPNYRNRYFTDFYWLHNPNKKMSIALSAYWGIQEKIIANGNRVSNNWGQMNVSMSYQFAKKWSVSGRVERFIDPNSVMVNPITPTNGFTTNSFSTCLNLSINAHILWRTECRIFSSANHLYLNQQNIPTNQLIWGISSIAIRF